MDCDNPTATLVFHGCVVGGWLQFAMENSPFVVDSPIENGDVR